MRRIVIAGGFGLMLGAAVPAAPMVVELTPAQIVAAMEHGRTVFERWRTEGKPIDDVEPGYVVDRGPDVGRAILSTEFSAVALETRRFLAIGQEIKPDQLERLTTDMRGRLEISVVITGPDREFLRRHDAHLVQGETRVRPVRWDVFRATQEKGRWVAPATYVFPTRDVDPQRAVALLLRDVTGHEIQFDFDLSSLK